MPSPSSHRSSNVTFHRWAMVRPSILVLILLYLFVPVAAQSQEREKLRISTLFIGASLAPLWIAQDQGIFARNGIDVELIWMQSALSTTALLAGEVDVIFGTPQTIYSVLTAKNPPPLVTIAAWGSASEHWLVVHPAIKSAKDLEGKTIGTSRPRSADQGYTLLILERLGVDTRKITFLSTGGQASRSAAVEAGTTVGSSFNRYYMLQLKRKGFRDLAKLERPDYPFPPSIFVVSIMEASERHKSDKELSLRLIRKNLRLENPEVLEAAYQDGMTLSYPYFTDRQFQVSLELLGKSMGQPVSLNYKQVVDRSLLDELGRPGNSRPE
jgi:NMT1/THI5 like protein